MSVHDLSYNLHTGLTFPFRCLHKSFVTLFLITLLFMKCRVYVVINLISFCLFYCVNQVSTNFYTGMKTAIMWVLHKLILLRAFQWNFAVELQSLLKILKWQGQFYVHRFFFVVFFYATLKAFWLHIKKNYIK